MGRQIKIKLLPNGKIQAETVGIKGPECLNYKDLIEKLTESKIIKEEKTSEYYETQAQTTETLRATDEGLY